MLRSTTDHRSPVKFEELQSKLPALASREELRKNLGNSQLACAYLRGSEIRESELQQDGEIRKRIPFR